MPRNPHTGRFRSGRYNPLKSAVLGVSVRRAERAPIVLRLSPTRRGCLEAIHSGAVRYYPSSGWKCDGKAINSLVRECVAAGWAAEHRDDTKSGRRIELTDAGRKAIGVEGDEAA